MRYSNSKSGKSKIVWIVALFVFLVGLILMVVGGYNYFTQVKQEPSSFPSSLEVVVTKGPISGAEVSVYELNVNGEKGDLIKGPLTSDVSGNVSFDLPANLPKRLFIESRGGSYKSEGTGQTVQLKDTDTLTAVLPAGTKTAAVTPFTHMAAALVKTKIQGGTSPDEAVISANQEVAKRYGLKSILETIPASEGTSEERQYGLLLAGFATIAKNLGVRSIDLSQALAEDWSDGITDGKENSKAIGITNGPALGSSASPSGLSQAADQFAKSGKAYGSKEASVVVSPKPAPAPAADFRITTTALPAWVSGKQGSYTITAEGGSLPLNWSVKSGSLPDGFTLSKDGVISGAFSLPQGVTKKIFPQFTAEAKDQTGKTQSITLSVTVVPEAPQITTYNPPTLTVGESYDEVVATANGGMPPYTFSREASSGPMPMGMQITSSGSDAHLTGSPKAKGNFSFRVCVADSASTEKCGSVMFAVKEEGIAAPAPAPAPAPATTPETPTTGGKWDGAYRGVCTVISSDIPSELAAEEPQMCDDRRRIYCPPYFFTVMDDYIWAKGVHRSDTSNYTKLVGGDIDSSGMTTIQEAENWNNTTSDWSLQFYLSGGEKYVKGTFTNTFECGWFSIEQRISWMRRCSCTYSLSGGPATGR